MQHGNSLRLEDPYPYYAGLRSAAGPIRLEMMGAWAISRYDDVLAVLKDHRTFSSTVLGNFAGARTVIGTDPPDHTRMRAIVNRAFTPKMVADMETRIREITTGLMDAVAGEGRFDLVADLSVPVPVIIIAEILGIDADRREDFKRWSDTLIFSRSASFDPREREEVQRDMEEFRSYFASVIAARRAAPRNDLISTLVQAEEADALTPEEVTAFTLLLLIAGNETTTNLISNGMLALLANPDELAKVQADLTLVPNMVEEALRYDSPVQRLIRISTRDAEIGGSNIPAGSLVMPIYASANRDERHFADPDRFDVLRANARDHIAFGYGAHFCLGAPLARLEAKVVFEELLTRFHNFGRLSDQVDRLDSVLLRGLKSFPLTFETAAVPR